MYRDTYSLFLDMTNLIPPRATSRKRMWNPLKSLPDNSSAPRRTTKSWKPDQWRWTFQMALLDIQSRVGSQVPIGRILRPWWVGRSWSWGCVYIGVMKDVIQILQTHLLKMRKLSRTCKSCLFGTARRILSYNSSSVYCWVVWSRW